jgi:hypothetical protein
MSEPNPFAAFDSFRSPAVAGGLAAPPTDDTPQTRIVVRPDDKSGENPFAQFDSLRGENAAPRSPTMKSIALQVPTGFNEATADIVGAPVDATTWLLNRIPGVKIDKPILGSQSIKDAMGTIRQSR